MHRWKEFSSFLASSRDYYYYYYYISSPFNRNILIEGMIQMDQPSPRHSYVTLHLCFVERGTPPPKLKFNSINPSNYSHKLTIEGKFFQSGQQPTLLLSSNILSRSSLRRSNFPELMSSFDWSNALREKDEDKSCFSLSSSLARGEIR